MRDLTIVVDGAQGRFRTTNWYITAAVTLLSGILAYFVSGHALKPLRSFASQVEKVQLNNLADMKIDEDVLPEFRAAQPLLQPDAGAAEHTPLPPSGSSPATPPTSCARRWR